MIKLVPSNLLDVCRIVEDNMKVTTSFVYDKVSAVAEQIKHKTIDPDNASVLVSDCLLVGFI